MTERRPIVILAALPPEVAPLERGLRGVDLVRVVATGMGLRCAAAVARREGAGAALLLSAGCCGGLAEAAVPGSIVVPCRVLRDDGAVVEAPPPDGEWSERLRDATRARSLPCTGGALVSVRRALTTPEHKRACRERTGADAVDMETAAVAQTAFDLAVPYSSIRVVLDAVDEAIPEVPVDEDGHLELRRLGLLARPQAARSLLRLALRLRELMPRLVGCVRDAVVSR